MLFNLYNRRLCAYNFTTKPSKPIIYNPPHAISHYDTPLT